MSKKLSLFCLVILLLFSCGKSSEETVEQAIITAENYLGAGLCQSAIDELEKIGRQNENARYLITLASGYACRAGYDTPTFITSHLPNFATPATLGGTTTFSTSQTMDAPDNDAYEDVQTAIDILLYAGGIESTKNPTVARRAAKFTSREAAGINSFLMYLLITQLGKYLYYYGNASAAGVKGGGTTFTNNCIMNYTTTTTLSYDDDGSTGPNPPINTDVGTVLDSTTNGACDSTQAGHPHLNIAASKTKRLCQGVVIWNNFLAVFPEVIGASTGGDFGRISGVQTTIDLYKDIVSNARTADARMTDLVDMLSQTKCESEYSDTDEYFDIFFSLYFEILFV